MSACETPASPCSRNSGPAASSSARRVCCPAARVARGCTKVVVTAVIVCWTNKDVKGRRLFRVEPDHLMSVHRHESVARPDGRAAPVAGSFRAMIWSYARGAEDVPLLEETIGANLWRTVQRFPEREALVVPHQDY